MEKSEILLNQQKFAEEEDMVLLPNGQLIPFTNLLDKGYRIVRLCYRFGKQMCHQPTFAKSDQKFSSDEMLVSATTAANRSENK